MDIFGALLWQNHIKIEVKLAHGLADVGTLALLVANLVGPHPDVMRNPEKVAKCTIQNKTFQMAATPFLLRIKQKLAYVDIAKMKDLTYR